jgi:nucleotide-binding universal stress UspA family protein
MINENAFRSILVGANGTPESERAVEVALSLGKSLQAHVTVLGVIPPLSAETQAEGVGLEEASEARERLRQQLSEAAAAGLELQIAVATEAVEGNPEKEIERKAEEASVDLIVVGHRDIARVRRWLEGSTSEGLVRSACTSVLVVHDDAAKL